MPFKKCERQNKKGYKWGNKGTCYTGKDAKKIALKQGRAIQAKKYGKKRSKLNGNIYQSK